MAKNASRLSEERLAQLESLSPNSAAARSEIGRALQEAGIRTSNSDALQQLAQLHMQSELRGAIVEPETYNQALANAGLSPDQSREAALLLRMAGYQVQGPAQLTDMPDQLTPEAAKNLEYRLATGGEGYYQGVGGIPTELALRYSGADQASIDQALNNFQQSNNGTQLSTLANQGVQNIRTAAAQAGLNAGLGDEQFAIPNWESVANYEREQGWSESPWVRNVRTEAESFRRTGSSATDPERLRTLGFGRVGQGGTGTVGGRGVVGYTPFDPNAGVIDNSGLSLTPGRVTPGSTTPGSTTPGSVTPGGVTGGETATSNSATPVYGPDGTKYSSPGAALAAGVNNFTYYRPLISPGLIAGADSIAGGQPASNASAVNTTAGSALISGANPQLYSVGAPRVRLPAGVKNAFEQ